MITSIPLLPKLSYTIGIIRTPRNIIPIETLTCLYNAIVQPHVGNVDIVYDSTSKTKFGLITKLQTRAI